MTEEGADLGIACRVQGGGDALVMRPQIFDSELAEPGVQRVSAAVRAVVRCREIRVPPRLLGDPPRRYAELRRCGGFHEGQVLLVVRGVVNRLAANHATVADQVGKESYPVFGPAQSGV